MTRTTSLVAMLIVGWTSAGMAFQVSPDFSGRWTTDPNPATKPPAAGAPAPPPRGDMGSGWGSAITIAQDARQLVVEHALFSRYDLQPPLRLVYALDGSETRNAVMMGHTTDVRRSRAAWAGQTLIITTVYPFTDPASGKAFTTDVTYRLSLESPTALIIEATRSGALGGQPSTTRTAYRKN